MMREGRNDQLPFRGASTVQCTALALFTVPIYLFCRNQTKQAQGGHIFCCSNLNVKFLWYLYLCFCYLLPLPSVASRRSELPPGAPAALPATGFSVRRPSTRAGAIRSVILWAAGNKRWWCCSPTGGTLTAANAADPDCDWRDLWWFCQRWAGGTAAKVAVPVKRWAAVPRSGDRTVVTAPSCFCPAVAGGVPWWEDVRGEAPGNGWCGWWCGGGSLLVFDGGRPTIIAGGDPILSRLATTDNRLFAAAVSRPFELLSGGVQAGPPLLLLLQLLLLVQLLLMVQLLLLLLLLLLLFAPLCCGSSGRDDSLRSSTTRNSSSESSSSVSPVSSTPSSRSSFLTLSLPSSSSSPGRLCQSTNDETMFKKETLGTGVHVVVVAPAAQNTFLSTGIC